VRTDIEALYRELADAMWDFGDREVFTSLLSLDLDEPAQDAPLEALSENPGLISFRLPPLPKPVNINTHVNVNITVTITAVAIAVLLIPVIVIGLAAQPGLLGREELVGLSDAIDRELQERAASLRAAGELRSLGRNE
jgi:hypothetical protein